MSLELKLVSFQSNAGISVDDFIRLTESYLSSTLINLDCVLYAQKDGIWIGSSMTHVLTEVYLNTLYLVISNYIKSLQVNSFPVSKYVDDTFICSLNHQSVTEVKSVIFQSGHELIFSIDEPVDDTCNPWT